MFYSAAPVRTTTRDVTATKCTHTCASHFRHPRGARFLLQLRTVHSAHFAHAHELRETTTPIEQSWTLWRLELVTCAVLWRDGARMFVYVYLGGNVQKEKSFPLTLLEALHTLLFYTVVDVFVIFSRGSSFWFCFDLVVATFDSYYARQMAEPAEPLEHSRNRLCFVLAVDCQSTTCLETISLILLKYNWDLFQKGTFTHCYWFCVVSVSVSGHTIFIQSIGWQKFKGNQKICVYFTLFDLLLQSLFVTVLFASSE